MAPATRDSIFKSGFLTTFEFNDTTLLYTDIYTDKVMQFIEMFVDRKASPRENENNIIRALDILVPRLDINPNIQQHLLQFLITGFEVSKLENVLAHISSNYLQQCGGSKAVIERRLAGYQKMAVGKTVPDFTVMDIQNNPVNLYNLLSPYRLIIFWHTDCSHCQVLLDELPELAKQEFFKNIRYNSLESLSTTTGNPGKNFQQITRWTGSTPTSTEVSTMKFRQPTTFSQPHRCF